MLLGQRRIYAYTHIVVYNNIILTNWVRALKSTAGYRYITEE